MNNGVKEMDSRCNVGTSRERPVGSGRREEKWKLMDITVMFRTSLLISWDRRRSMNFDQRFMKAMREMCNEEDIVNEEDVNENDFDSQVVSVASERVRDAALSRKGDGILNLMKIGRYKYNFIVDYEKFGKEIRTGAFNLEKIYRKVKKQLFSGVGVAVDVMEDKENDIPEAPNDSGVNEDRNDENAASEFEMTDDAKKRAERVIVRKEKVKFRRNRWERIDLSQFRLIDCDNVRAERNLRLKTEWEWFEEGCNIG